MNELVNVEKQLPQTNPIKRAGKNPLTVIAVVGGALITTTGIIMAEWLVGVLGFILLSGGLTLFFTLSIFFGITSAVKSTHDKIYTQNELKRLAKSLRKHGDLKAANKTLHIKVAYENFVTRLDERIGKSAEEYHQYFAPAQDLHDAAIRNLKAIDRFHQDIEISRVRESRDAIQRYERSGIGDSTEIDNHRRKVAVAEQSQIKIEELRHEVDNANTVLIEVANQLNDIVTDRAEVQKSAATAMAKFNKAAEMNRKINEKVKNAWEMLS